MSNKEEIDTVAPGVQEPTAGTKSQTPDTTSTTTQPVNDTVNATDSDEEDSDYDPDAKQPEDNEPDSESDKEEYNYSAIGSSTTQVRTRNQRYQETTNEKLMSNIVGEVSNVDFDSIFNDLKLKSIQGKSTKEVLGEEVVQSTEKSPEKAPEKLDPVDDDVDKVWIKTSYVFAGKVITESKQVDANSAEAKAFLNSAAGIQMVSGEENGKKRSFVPIIRSVDGYDEPLELRIKLKRPSLIDRFMSSQGNKEQKLSTLEKSRLDWACFVDENKISDDLKLHNKDGYLEKQDFLGRLQHKQDKAYENAREADRIKRWQDQQKA